MRWNKNAKKAIATDVERELDKIRDNILTKAKKMGGWNSYIFDLQKGVAFTDPRR